MWTKIGTKHSFTYMVYIYIYIYTYIIRKDDETLLKNPSFMLYTLGEGGQENVPFVHY